MERRREHWGKRMGSHLGWVRAGCAVVWGILLAVPQGMADTVYLQDGSQLMGTVDSWSAGQLRVSTGFAGELSVPADEVIGISTSTDRVVALESGDEIVGQLNYTDGEGQTLENELFGSVSIEPASIQAIWEPGQAEPEVEATEEAYTEKVEQLEKEHADTLTDLKEEHTAETKKLQLQIEKRADPWSGQFELGLNGQTGNRDRVGLRSRAEVRRTTDFDRFLLYLQGRYAEQDQVRSENEILGGAKLEVDVSERFFTLGKVEMEFDEFEDLDLRTRITAGMGYFVIKEPKHQWKVFASPGYQHESFMDGTTTDQAIVELGWEYDKEMAPWLLFQQDTTLIPSISEVNDYRVVADTSAEIPITPDERWRIKFGIRNEYDNQPIPGVKELDTSYYANLTLSFR